MLIEKMTEKELKGKFIMHTGIGKVALFFKKYSDGKRIRVVKEKNFKDESGVHSVWMIKYCEVCEKPVDWKGPHKAGPTLQQRKKIAAKKRDRVRKMAADGMTRPEIIKKTGYSRTVIDRYFQALPSYQNKTKKNNNDQKEYEEKFVNPGNVWHGRYCKNPGCTSPGKKIIGKNRIYCKKCHSIILEKYDGHDYIEEGFSGQLFSSL